eukprot:648262-Pleurochrysis_carterae.AAC.2
MKRYWLSEDSRRAITSRTSHAPARTPSPSSVSAGTHTDKGEKRQKQAREGESLTSSVLHRTNLRTS